MSENEKTTAVATRPALEIGAGSVVAIVPQTVDEMYRVANLIAKSGLAPKSLPTAEAVAVAIMAGAEVGVPPMASLQNIAVINGRPCMWGDLIVALVQQSGKLEYLVETWDAKTQTATVRCKRIGKPERVEVFGMDDARRAKLAGKDLYQTYPQRMCGWRAKTYAIRAEFADVLKGLSVREEVEDYIDVTPTVRELPPMPRAAEAPSPVCEPEPEPEMSAEESAAMDAKLLAEEQGQATLPLGGKGKR